MHTLTAIAQKAGLPRRTVQYWQDKGAITPINEKPVVYDDEGVVLVRMLGALAQNKPQIEWIREISRKLRLCMMDDESVPHSVRQAFVAARAGEDAFLIIAPELLSNGSDIFDRTVGAVGKSAMSAAVASQIKHSPNLAATVMDLTYAFNLKFQFGAIMDD